MWHQLIWNAQWAKFLSNSWLYMNHLLYDNCWMSEEICVWRPFYFHYHLQKSTRLQINLHYWYYETYKNMLLYVQHKNLRQNVYIGIPFVSYCSRYFYMLSDLNMQESNIMMKDFFLLNVMNYFIVC